MLVPDGRWLYCCLLFLLVACRHHSNDWVISSEDPLAESKRIQKGLQQLDSCKAIVHTGDLITRTGNDFTSESFRKLNRRDQAYSHCGIASIEHDSIFIYHALGGEFNPDQKIRRDVMDLFAQPYENRGIGIFRFALTPAETDSLVATVQKLYRSGVMFDMKFDMATDDRMYCAEFVCKSYSNAISRLHFDTSHIKAFAFTGVDDLFLHPECKVLKKVLYK